MTASERGTNKQRTGKKHGTNIQGQDAGVLPLTPPLIIRVGVAVVHNMPEGCRRLPAPLLQETLITASQLTGNPGPDVTLAVEEDAAIREVYLAMRERRIHPRGDFDRQGRWYPSDAQSAGGMTVRSPSKHYPYSYLTACRTLRHTRCVAETSPDLFREQLEAALRSRFPVSTTDPLVN